MLDPSFQPLRDPRVTMEASRPLEGWTQDGYSITSAYVPLEQAPDYPRFRGRETDATSQWELQLVQREMESFIVRHS